MESRRDKAARAEALPDPSAGPAVVLPALERSLLKIAQEIRDLGYKNPEKLVERKSEVAAKVEQLAALVSGRAGQ